MVNAIALQKEPMASQLSSLPGLSTTGAATVATAGTEDGVEETKINQDELPQTLEQQESMKISGTNARHMVMQKLMRKSEVVEVILNVI